MQLSIVIKCVTRKNRRKTNLYLVFPPFFTLRFTQKGAAVSKLLHVFILRSIDYCTDELIRSALRAEVSSVISAMPRPLDIWLSPPNADISSARRSA